MKKILALVLAVLMIASLGVLSMAEKGGFVYSPSVNPAPGIEEQEHPGDCGGEIVVTPYPERDELDEDGKKEIEEAYDEIVGLEEGDPLHDAIEKVAEELGVDPDTVRVSDLFNISCTDCPSNDKSEYSLKLSSDTFKNYAGLLHYVDGQWVAVDARLDENGYLTFTYDGFGAFAVLVKTAESPVTGDNGVFVLCVIMMIISLAGFVTVTVIVKKKTAKAR